MAFLSGPQGNAFRAACLPGGCHGVSSTHSASIWGQRPRKGGHWRAGVGKPCPGLGRRAAPWTHRREEPPGREEGLRGHRASEWEGAGGSQGEQEGGGAQD